MRYTQIGMDNFHENNAKYIRGLIYLLAKKVTAT